MLNEDVKRAVDHIHFAINGAWEPQSTVWNDFAIIRAHLEAQEAEICRVAKSRDYYERCAELLNDKYMTYRSRAEKDEALLRELAMASGAGVIDGTGRMYLDSGQKVDRFRTALHKATAHLQEHPND